MHRTAFRWLTLLLPAMRGTGVPCTLPNIHRLFYLACSLGQLYRLPIASSKAQKSDYGPTTLDESWVDWMITQGWWTREGEELQVTSLLLQRYQFIGKTCPKVVTFFRTLSAAYALLKPEALNTLTNFDVTYCCCSQQHPYFYIIAGHPTILTARRFAAVAQRRLAPNSLLYLYLRYLEACALTKTLPLSQRSTTLSGAQA